ncbi:hypothetical protein TNCT_244851 [Trichonephila clavata]|uniref:Uncharacterized protein n=1 Tax=Trichonephila clavata TaxID=2740835 RepID=A0A8X6KDV4_TRICU|nr:hypothetical protein TNCT_244851 [Trichonephila clavata]
MWSTQRSSLGTVVFALTNIRASPSAVCMFPKQEQLDVRIADYHKYSQFLSISLLNHVQTVGYMGHGFGSGFDGKRVDFNSTVSAIHCGYSQVESCRRVGAPD